MSAMGRRWLSSGTSSQVEHIALTKNIVELWRAVGTAHGLGDDHQIALFLLQLYEKSVVGINNNTEHCIRCNQPLSRHFCSQCSANCYADIIPLQRSLAANQQSHKTTDPSVAWDSVHPGGVNVKEELVGEDEGKYVASSASGRDFSWTGNVLPENGEQRGIEVKIETVDHDHDYKSEYLEESIVLDGYGVQTDYDQDDADLKPADRIDDDLDMEPISEKKLCCRNLNDSNSELAELNDDASDMELVPALEMKKKRIIMDPDFEPLEVSDSISAVESAPTTTCTMKKKCKLKDKPAVKFECKHCNASFITARGLKRHSKIHAADYGKDRLYSCDQCQMTFRLKGSLEAHMRKHSGQQPFMCAICNQSFTLAKETKQHVESQHNDKANVIPCFRCNFCHVQFLSYKKFTNHVWRHTLERKFQCEHCPMAFFERSNLKVHQRIHTGCRPYTCTVCGMSFRQLSGLNGHMLTHSGERPYQCTLCPMAYPNSHQLKRHLRGHRGEKPYLCQLCGASYTESKSLTYHIRSHTGEKPCKCDICGKDFARPSSLRVHKLVHSSNRPYICTICGVSYADNSNLHRHHRRKHSGKSKRQQTATSCGDGSEQEAADCHQLW